MPDREGIPMREKSLLVSTEGVVAPPKRLRSSPFRDMHLIDSDEPLLALLNPQEQEILRATGTYEEMAKILAVPSGTVRSRLHRARAKLVALRKQSGSMPH